MNRIPEATLTLIAGACTSVGFARWFIARHYSEPLRRARVLREQRREHAVAVARVRGGRV